MKPARVLGLVLLLALLVVVPARAEDGAVVTAEGQRVSGALALTQDQAIAVTPASGEPRTFALVDLQTVLLRPDLSPGKADLKLLDNDGLHGARTVSASIKLKAGLHRITIAYWQAEGGRDLKLEVEGPDLPRRIMPGSMMFNVRNEADPPVSEGFDADGHRLPEDPEDVRPRIRYRFFVGEQGAAWDSMDIFRQLQQKRSGTSDQVSLRVSNQTSHFGIVFSGYFQAPADGEYTFHLTSDDGAAMWLGKDPAMMSTLGAGATAPEARPWHFELSGNGQLAGKITAITDAVVTIAVPVGDQTLGLAVPRAHIRSIAAVGRSTRQLPPPPLATQDTAYVLRQLDDGSEEVRTVSGKAVSIEGDELVFAYKGEPRRIALAKLVALVPGRTEVDAAARRAFSQRFDLLAGHILPGTWTGMDEQAVTLRTAWGQDVSLPRAAVAQVRMVGGRLIYLAHSDPDDVRQTPWFDRVLPVQRNQAIGGGDLTIYSGQPVTRGFAVAGRTLLHFELGGEFERLTTIAAIHKPTGELADVDIRVLGDGKVLFEKLGLRADDAPAKIDLDITGVQQLTLETDFGGGQDVGDRVVWGDPRVIRKQGGGTP